MSRLFPVAVLVIAAGVAAGQPPFRPAGEGEPPGTIVVSPKRPGTVSPPAGTGEAVAVLKGTDPDHPGFLVISPRRSDAVPLGTPKLETRDGVPHLVITGSKQDPPPATDPRPTTGGKTPPATTTPTAKPDEVKDGKILVETYDVASCRGCKVGYFHTLVREYERDGKAVRYATNKLVLQLARFGQPVEQWSEEMTIETADGKVLVTQMRQGIGRNQVLSLTGEVTAKGLEVKIEGAAAGSEVVKWPEGVLGISRSASFLADTKPKAGDVLEYRAYAGQFNTVVTHTVTAKGLEEVKTDPAAKPRKLLRFDMAMKPIGEFKLPPTTVYADPDTFEPVLMTSDLPMLGGVLSAVRSTRDAAMRKPVKYLDLGEVQSIPLAKTVANIHEKQAVTYRVTLGGELPLDKAFTTDARQSVANTDAKSRTFDLTVASLRQPARLKEPAAAPGKECLADCYFIDWDNDLTKRHAKAAVAGLGANATDWQKAKAVEAWVHANMKQVEFSQAMATCSNVAKELSGDCTEHAMLAAGMCRALGVPSRTALGLVYAPTRAGGAQLAYHMWFEVWADGRWVAFDAILGMGGVGPGHLKITDAHWDGEKGFTPVLPVLAVLGTAPKVEIVTAK